MNKTSSKFEDDGSVSQGMSKRSSKRSLGATERDKSLGKTAENFKYELPPNCLLNYVKKLLIDKMPGKYFLSAHPYPKIDGEMFILKPKKQDQGSKDAITYRDYSLRKRIENSGGGMTEGRKTMRSKDAEDQPKHIEPEAKLQCLDIDLENPLSREEWNNFVQVVEATQGLGWFQILPVGQKSSMPYQFNMLHCLPSKNIPCERLPIDVFFANQVSLQRKKERQHNSAVRYDPEQLANMTAREHLEQKALDVGLIMIPEFQFDHVFYALNQENLLNDPATQMAEIYSRCCEFLRLSTRPNVGITVIVSPRWFFLCILTQPYCQSPSGNPVYLDGFDFAGLVSLQQIDETWPATAGLED